MRAQALETLERGGVLYLPSLRFELAPDEQGFLTPDCLDARRKNISLDPQKGQLQGTRLTGPQRDALLSMMRRFGEHTLMLLAQLLPSYRDAITQARVSYRPAEVDDRRLSPRKDDRRLHVDAFTSRPNHGQRILRVFSNINPEGRARHWRIGEPFEACARRFFPMIRPPLAGAHTLLALLGVTQGRRSDYDHYMLRMHDRMKMDEVYQRNAPRHEADFAAGSSWIVFSDQTLHAALSGQYLLEQTLHLPVTAMHIPERSPLRVLERIAGRALA
ncbi:MAG: Kdo hydroxylase family protein [Acidiferrobacteraceae bacterium]